MRSASCIILVFTYGERGLMKFRIKKVVLTAVLFSVLWGTAYGEEMRIWTSKKGDAIEARYVRQFAGGKVVLKTSDGRELKIPVSGLSSRDQDYLASLVPPKLKINVDVDTDTQKVNEYYDFTRKREIVKGLVDLEKTNREPCNKVFRIHFYIFAKQMGGSSYWLISYVEKKESFAGTSKNIVFRSDPVEVGSESSSYSSSRGFKYDGYLVVVEDEAGEMVLMESNRGIYESNWSKIKGAEKGAEFDRDFEKYAKKRTSSFSRNH
jgi:hypothetical protein